MDFFHMIYPVVFNKGLPLFGGSSVSVQDIDMPGPPNDQFLLDGKW